MIRQKRSVRCPRFTRVLCALTWVAKPNSPLENYNSERTDESATASSVVLDALSGEASAPQIRAPSMPKQANTMYAHPKLNSLKHGQLHKALHTLTFIGLINLDGELNV